jgi:chaperonin GroES
MKIIPVGDVVMVKEVEVLGKTKGGLYIPESAQQQGSMAVNVATFEVTGVGTGKPHPTTGELIPLTLKVGQKVLMARESLSEYAVGLEKGFFSKSGAVIALVED